MEKNPQKQSLRYRSFELAYRAVAKPLMRFIIRKMDGDIQAAEEVFSRTALAALKGYNTFEHKSSYFTWICKIALNKTADYYRERINDRSKFIAPTLEGLARIPSPTLSAEEKLALQQLKQAVYECLLLLPEDKRRILYLKYWKDLSHKEIAKKLGTTERAVEGKIYRARNLLKIIILDQHPDLAFD